MTFRAAPSMTMEVVNLWQTDDGSAVDAVGAGRAGRR